ncbi:hypothetical protein J7M07_05135 [bacterium]|nr:hypothetical protein [bacterium]
MRKHLPGEKAESKSDQRLSVSVAELGLLHSPALLQSDNGNPEDGIVIFGHRRIAAAAAAGVKKINAVIFSVSGAKINEIIALRLEELSSGAALSELEEIITIDKITAFSGRPAEEMLPLLSKSYGRKLSRDYLYRLINLLKLEDNILEALHTGEISTGDLLALSEHPHIDQTKAALLLAGETLNRGKQKEAVRLILYLADQGMGRWDKFLSDFRSGEDSLLESLHNACYPALQSDLKNISTIIEGIGLPRDAIITPPCNLEGGHYTLRIKIRDEKSFSNILTKLGKFSKENGILTLLDILKGKKS